MCNDITKNLTHKELFDSDELDFILGHFAASWFPRRISTKTTEGRQITVNSKEEALARFKQANYLDCRISAYSCSDIKNDPNFLFIDLDTASQKTLDRTLEPPGFLLLSY